MNTKNLISLMHKIFRSDIARGIISRLWQRQGGRITFKISVLILVGILLTTTMLSGAVAAPASSQSTKAEIGGFLLPFSNVNQFHLGDWTYFEGSTHAGIEAYDFVQDNNNDSIYIQAPKSGVVLAARDTLDYVSYKVDNGSCVLGNSNTMNYILLGHGGIQDGEYDHYTVIYHLSHNSLLVHVGEWVEVGQRLATVGKVGNTGGAKHIHMSVHKQSPRLSNPHTIKTCDGTTVLENATYPWDQGQPDNAKSFGFSEFDNVYEINSTIFNNLPNSWNNENLISDNCNPTLISTKVVLYEHIDYGGECVVVPDPSSGYNVPSERHISSIYLKPSWINSVTNGYKTLTLWDSPRLYFKVISASVPNLIPDGWNDRVAYVHNQSHSNTPWLLEESYAFEAPFDLNVHIRINVDQDLVAWRVCFDGDNCQENATPINELYYTWNTYGVGDGNHTISIQYRRTSDNGNWANADYYEVSYYLSPNRQGYAPCGTNVEGAKLTSGVDCIIVTNDVSELAAVGWGDRPNLMVCANGGYTAWVYDGVPDQFGNFGGTPKVVLSGYCIVAGSNVSSIDLKSSAEAPPPDPATPFGIDSATVHLFHFDEGNGSVLHDSAGTLDGSIAGDNWISGKFGNGMYFPDPPNGRGVTFAPIDVCPMTFEAWVRTSSLGGRIAGQLGTGGGGDTGNLKWMLSLDGRHPKIEIWAGGGSQWVTSYKEMSAADWHYIMFTYDCGTQAVLYLDNEVVGQLATASIWNSGATTLEIGASEGTGKCNCDIDEARISNTVRVPTFPEEPPPPVSTLTPTITPTVTPINTPFPALLACSTPQNVSNTAGNSQYSAMWTEPSGVTHTVWEEEITPGNWVILFRKIAADGTLGPVETVSTLHRSVEPSIAVDSSGTVYVAFAAEVTNFQVWYAFKPAGGTWSAPVQVTNATVGASGQDLALGSDGTLYLAYYENNSSGQGEIYIRLKAPGGAWSAPEQVATTPGHSTNPSIAVDTLGNLQMIWLEGYPNGRTYEASKPAGGSWSPAAPLSMAGEPAWQNDLSVDSQGGFHAVWSQGDGKIYYASRPAGGLWSTPVQIPDALGIRPVITVDTQDTIRASWGGLSYAIKPLSGNWYTQQQIAQPGWYGNVESQSGIGADAQGNVHFVWNSNPGENPEIWHVECAHVSPPTPTLTATSTSTATLTATPTLTATQTHTVTPSLTPTVTQLPTDTITPTHTPTNSPSPTMTPTLTGTPTLTPTKTPTRTPTLTPTPTGTLTRTQTTTPTLTLTPTKTLTRTVTLTATLTATKTPVTISFVSIDASDGWVLESSENSNVGGTFNSTAATFNLGDDASKKQYRGILSFNTAGLPDNAVITSATLKVKQQATTGGNLLSGFQGFIVDLKSGPFGAATLQALDFQAAPSTTLGPFSPSLVGNWYSINLTNGKDSINKLATNGGLTQIRLRFKLDDNNNAVANYLSLFSGSAAAGNRPQLVITYVP